MLTLISLAYTTYWILWFAAIGYFLIRVMPKPDRRLVAFGVALFAISAIAHAQQPGRQRDCVGEYAGTVNANMNRVAEQSRAVTDRGYLYSTFGWGVVVQVGNSLEWVARSEAAMFQLIGCVGMPTR